MQNTNKKNRTYDLADRLISFNLMIGNLCDLIVKTKEGLNIKTQLSRSVSSAALNYGEALVPESTPDFIHKIGICLKELMESKMSLSLVVGRNLCEDQILAKNCIGECSELIAIFIASKTTAKNNLRNAKSK